MFKYLTLFIAAFLLCQTGRANKVDDLKTDEDVAKFITSLDKMFIERFSPPLLLQPLDKLLVAADCDDIKDWQAKKWEKIDLNKDGRTDLLVNASWYDQNNGFVAIDNGNNTFRLIRLAYSPFGKYEISKTAIIDAIPVVLFHYTLTIQKPDGKGWKYAKIPVIDTLVYKFNDLIEPNKIPGTRRIESIKYETVYCGGICPVYSMEIDKEHNALYKAEPAYIKNGTFKAKIKPENFTEIYDLLSYLNVENLNDNYDCFLFDAPACLLTITFSDGKIKTIKDAGQVGTFGLRKIYSLISALPKNQNWQPAN